MRNIRCAFVVALALLLGSSQCRADDTPTENAAVPEIHIVLFTPSGIIAPEGAVERIGQAAEIAERFFVTGMKRWKYVPAREQIFSRDESGKIKVLTIQGSETADSKTYQTPGLLDELWPKVTKKYGLQSNFPVWWVWVYLGDPPVRFNDYRGSGSLRRGGWALVNYENRRGELNAKGPLGGGFNEEFTLKGCIHELGHAMGMPHLGPMARDNAGNSLMGPNMGPFQQQLRTPVKNVYLSHASAAILWKHFAFSGTTKDREIVPTIELPEFEAKSNRGNTLIVVSGRAKTSLPAHSVILADDAEPGQSDYWRKSYVSRIDGDGGFKFNVNEPSGRNGQFRLLFCFENGAIVGPPDQTAVENPDDEAVNKSRAWKYQFNGKNFQLAQ